MRPEISATIAIASEFLALQKGEPARGAALAAIADLNRSTKLREDLLDHRLSGIAKYLFESSVTYRKEMPELYEWLCEQHHRNLKAVGRSAVTEALVSAELQKSGIRHKFIKGLSIARRLYPEARVRHAGDVDLLVELDQLGNSKSVLATLGFRKRSFGPMPVGYEALYLKSSKDYTFAGYGIALELHARLSPVSQAVAEHYRSCALSENPLGDDQVHAELLYLCFHGATYGFYSRLKWLVDIALFFERPEINSPQVHDKLLRKAIELGALRYLSFSWHLAHLTLGVSPPNWLADELRKDPQILRMVKFAERGWERSWDKSGGVQAFWQRLKRELVAPILLAGSRREKAKILIHFALRPTPADLFLLRFLSPRLYAIHWLLRPFTLILRKLKPLPLVME